MLRLKDKVMKPLLNRISNCCQHFGDIVTFLEEYHVLTLGMVIHFFL
jgi:hypothetical protein